MPFKKLGSDRYQGPTGKVFNAAQVKLYYANGGKFPGEKEDASGRHESSLNPVMLRDNFAPHVSTALPRPDRPLMPKGVHVRMPHVGLPKISLKVRMPKL